MYIRNGSFLIPVFTRRVQDEDVQRDKLNKYNLVRYTFGAIIKDYL